jgi:hypothetical protein
MWAWQKGGGGKERRSGVAGVKQAQWRGREGAGTEGAGTEGAGTEGAGTEGAGTEGAGRETDRPTSEDEHPCHMPAHCLSSCADRSMHASTGEAVGARTCEDGGVVAFEGTFKQLGANALVDLLLRRLRPEREATRIPAALVLVDCCGGLGGWRRCIYDADGGVGSGRWAEFDEIGKGSRGRRRSKDPQPELLWHARHAVRTASTQPWVAAHEASNAGGERQRHVAFPDRIKRIDVALNRRTRRFLEAQRLDRPCVCIGKAFLSPKAANRTHVRADPCSHEDRDSW